MTESKINIIICDNNREVCNVLNDYLLYQKDIVVTGIAKDGVEAIKLIQEKKQRTLALGADQYVVKPFDLDVFVKRIRQMFNNSTLAYTTAKPLIS